MDRVIEEDEVRMKQNGVKIVNFGAEIASKLNVMYNEGILTTAGKSSPKEVQEFWDLAKSKNMLNQ